MISRRSVCPALLILAMVMAAAPLRAQQRLGARAVTQGDRVYLGQSFLYQIQIEGTDSPEQPDMAGLLQDFQVEPAGGGASNSEQIAFANGRLQRVSRKGYQLNYRLTPRREGRLTIPPVTIRAQGQATQTNPVTVDVRPPEEIEDFKLRMSLSDRTAYVGQPVVLAITWYIGRSVDQFQFDVPALEDDRFQIIDPRVRVPADRQGDYVDIPIGSGRVTARKGRGRLDGWEFLTVTFEKVLVPKRAGTLTLDPAVVNFRAIRERGRGPFSSFNFGDPFFGQSRGHENLAVPSNALTLEVRETPAEGRPANFSGLIGSFRFTAEAQPTDVSVGDPITLELEISGPEYLDYIRLPELQGEDRLRRDFQIPTDPPPGSIVGKRKVFTRTIRARTAAAREIPALTLNYFNPETGRYETASTDAIPLEVRGARVLTAADAEGEGSVAEARSEIDTRREGIAAQYEGVDALDSHRAGIVERLAGPLWVTALLAPPLGFLALLGWRSRRTRDGAPERRSRKARRELEAGLNALPDDDSMPGKLLDLMRDYLGLKLSRPPRTITFADVGPVLQAGGVPEEGLADLRAVFDAAEAGRFGGVTWDAASRDELRGKARRAVEAIEGAIR